MKKFILCALMTFVCMATIAADVGCQEPEQNTVSLLSVQKDFTVAPVMQCIGVEYVCEAVMPVTAGIAPTVCATATTDTPSVAVVSVIEKETVKCKAPPKRYYYWRQRTSFLPFIRHVNY